MHSELLKRLQVVEHYLTLLSNHDFNLLDLNLVEPFYLEDKKYHPTNIVFERNNELQAIRSDWTRSILNYKQLYNMKEHKFAYYGPVVRENRTIQQAGIEMFAANADEIINTIILHLSFVQTTTQKPIQTLIVNDEKLIDLYLEKYQLSAEIKSLLYDKDISALKEQLGSEHPLYQLMIVPVSQQFDLIQAEFGQSQEIQALDQLKSATADLSQHFILDLSFRSPQKYYNGFYFQVFQDKNTPALSGGQYADDAFGIALNLSNGGIV